MINDYLDTEVTIANTTGLDGYGKQSYGPTFIEKCRWMPVSRLKQKPMADNVVVAIKADFNATADVEVNSRITKDGINYLAIEVSDRNFVGYGSHKEVLLKYE